MVITSIIKAISDMYQNNDKNKMAYYIKHLTSVCFGHSHAFISYPSTQSNEISFTTKSRNQEDVFRGFTEKYGQREDFLNLC